MLATAGKTLRGTPSTTGALTDLIGWNLRIPLMGADSRDAPEVPRAVDDAKPAGA
jgi:hypothetical protein